MIYLIAPWIPFAIDAAREIGGNILQGINNRKARKYNSEQEQVRRRLEAGLPIGSGNISGGVQTPTQVDKGQSATDYIQKSVSTNLTKKQLDLIEQQVRKATAEADIAEGERDWKLANPETSPYGPMGTSNLQYGLNTQRDIQTFQWVIERNRQDLDNMNFLYEKGLWEEGKYREQFDAQLESLLINISNATKTGTMLGLQIQNEEQITAVKNEIYNAMKSGRFPNISAILYALTFGQAQVPFRLPNFGMNWQGGERSSYFKY